MVERKKLLKNSKKIIEKRAADNQARKENRSRLILMRRKGILTELKEELKNIKQENLEQMLKALEVP